MNLEQACFSWYRTDEACFTVQRAMGSLPYVVRGSLFETTAKKWTFLWNQPATMLMKLSDQRVTNSVSSNGAEGGVAAKSCPYSSSRGRSQGGAQSGRAAWHCEVCRWVKEIFARRHRLCKRLGAGSFFEEDDGKRREVLDWSSFWGKIGKRIKVSQGWQRHRKDAARRCWKTRPHLKRYHEPKTGVKPVQNEWLNRHSQAFFAQHISKTTSSG